VELRQEGARLTGTLRGTQILTSCQLEGQVVGAQVSWRQSGCSEACALLHEGTCPGFRLCVVDHSFTGAVSGGRLSGEHGVSWETTDEATGRPMGRLEVHGTLDVRR
jgi:hypothetical protein